MTLGENIKNYRNKVNLTQKDLSEKLNVSYQTISKRENNTNEPDVATLKQLCSIFNCSLDDLLNYDKETITPPKKIQLLLKISQPRFKYVHVLIVKKNYILET